LLTCVSRKGIDAEYVSLEDIVPWSDEQEAAFDGTLSQDFYDKLARAVGERIQLFAPRVPVVTGASAPCILETGAYPV